MRQKELPTTITVAGQLTTKGNARSFCVFAGFSFYFEFLIDFYTGNIRQGRTAYNIQCLGSYGRRVRMIVDNSNSNAFMRFLSITSMPNATGLNSFAFILNQFWFYARNSTHYLFS